MSSICGRSFDRISMIVPAVFWWAGFFTKMDAAATPIVNRSPISLEARLCGAGTASLDTGTGLMRVSIPGRPV